MRYVSAAETKNDLSQAAKPYALYALTKPPEQFLYKKMIPG
jgi:hypothetical protein